MFDLYEEESFDPIGVAEIAEKLGVTRQKVASLKHHGKLPEPTKVLKCGPLWDAKEITGGNNDKQRNTNTTIKAMEYQFDKTNGQRFR